MCNHQWIVYSTSICPPTIMVYCQKCDKLGYVENYTEDEWHEAFYAPDDNYPWQGKGKVKLNE